jgi:hypothetical protein
MSFVQTGRRTGVEENAWGAIFRARGGAGIELPGVRPAEERRPPRPAPPKIGLQFGLGNQRHTAPHKIAVKAPLNAVGAFFRPRRAGWSGCLDSGARGPFLRRSRSRVEGIAWRLYSAVVTAQNRAAGQCARGGSGVLPVTLLFFGSRSPAKPHPSAVLRTEGVLSLGAFAFLHRRERTAKELGARRPRLTPNIGEAMRAVLYSRPIRRARRSS